MQKISREKLEQVETPEHGMQLHLRHVPEKLVRKLKIMAIGAGVTFQEMVVAILEEGAAETESVTQRERREARRVVEAPAEVVAEPEPEPEPERMTLGDELEEEWEPQVPQVSNPWEGAYEKIHGARKKPSEV